MCSMSALSPGVNWLVMTGARVIACGGGVVLDPGRRALLHDRCSVVWLEVSPENAARRVTAEEGRRPLLRGADPVARLTVLLDERAPLYAEVAHLRIATDDRTPEDVAGEILSRLATEAT